MTAITQEQLLEHSDWLRGLAARLVADPATADDLVQETWISALGANADLPEDGRPWLARVLRNKARNRWRAHTRREDREALAGESREVPTPAELAREAEAQQLVAAAVTQLDEPYRSVIVLRFFRGLDATEIGKLHKVSPSTVRSRVQRALSELRGQLDGEHGGRAAWSALLLPVLRTDVPRVAAAGAFAGSGGLLTVLLGVAAACALAWFGARELGGSAEEPGGEALFVARGALPVEVDESVREPETERLSSAPPRESADFSSMVSTSTTNSSTPAAGAAAGAPVSPRGSSASSTIDESLGDDARISGRFLMPDGSPAADLELRISARPVNSERTALHGLPDEWTAPQVSTDAEGRFEATFAVPRAYGYGLDAKLDGHAPDTWFWREVLPGTAIDVGTVQVRVGGVVEGILTRPDGSPLTGEDWSVSVRESSPPEAYGRERFHGQFEVDRVTGTFRAADLPPGSMGLSANSPMSETVAGPSVDVASGEVRVVPFVIDGPDFSKSLVISTRSRLMSYFGSLRPGSLRVSGGPNGPRTLEPVQGKLDLYRVDDLEPGSYVVEIDDDRFQPVLVEAVATGTRTHVDLVGSCSLGIELLDAEGEAVTIESITLRGTKVERIIPGLEGTEGFVQFVGTDPIEIDPHGELFVDGRIEGILPGSYQVIASGANDEQAEGAVQDLAPGEARQVTLSPTDASEAGLAGHVLKDDGSPVSSAEVWLLHPAQINDHVDSPVLRPGSFASPDTAYRKVKAQTVSAADGSFSFEDVSDGEFALAASHSALGEVATEAFLVTSGEDPGAFELRFPTEVTLQARIVGPPGSSTSGMSAYLIPAALDPESMQFFQLKMRGERLLGPDGELEVKGLAPGNYVPYLVLPPTQAKPGSGSNTLSSHGGSRSDLALEQVQLVGGVNEVELEVLTGFPGKALIEVVVNGQARSTVEIKLRSADPTRGGSRTGYTGLNGEPASIVTFPGGQRIEILDENEGWSYRSDHVLEVPAAGIVEHRAEFELASGQLMVRDSSGTPLAGAAVMLTFPEGSREWVGEPRVTDGEGVVELTLVPGNYRCYLLTLDGSDAQAVKSAKYSMMRKVGDLPFKTLSWTVEGAEVTF